MITNTLSVYMEVGGYIDNSDILAIKPPIITSINLWLEMCTIVVAHIDKWNFKL